MSEWSRLICVAMRRDRPSVEIARMPPTDRSPAPRNQLLGAARPVNLDSSAKKNKNRTSLWPRGPAPRP